MARARILRGRRRDKFLFGISTFVLRLLWGRLISSRVSPPVVLQFQLNELISGGVGRAERRENLLRPVSGLRRRSGGAAGANLGKDDSSWLLTGVTLRA